METPSPPLLCDSRVKLAASTGDITAAGGHRTSRAAAYNDDGDDVLNYFENAQWTADGTALLTYSSTNLVSEYVVPQDLLTSENELSLRPHSQIQLPERSNVLAGAPYFSLSEPWTQQVLVSAQDHPLQLFYLTPSSESEFESNSHPPIASYPFTKARSETFLPATALLWSSPGTHFIAGNRSLLARFDIQRTGGEPVSRIRTIPSERHLSKGGGVGMRGTVSALGGQPMDTGSGASLVAAGTWTRWIGLYDFAQAGECVATWSIAAAVRETGDKTVDGGEGDGPTPLPGGIGGDGITQTTWSPCGRYLVICERKSRGALIYDVRVTGKLLGYLTGRDALSNQRVACDVFPGGETGTDTSSGFEVWSGTYNGAVKVWEGVGSVEGPHAPAWGWAAHGKSTVGSTCLHPSGTVVATCAGSWEFPSVDDDDDPSDYGSSSSSGSSQSEDSTDPKEGSDESETSSEANSSDTSDVENWPSWMRRRNMESSLKIWSITGLPS